MSEDNEMSDIKMKTYIGTKQVKARPCTAVEANAILGREIDTKTANAAGDGYLVEYKDGYQSWSPAEPFEEAYHELNGMSFGAAFDFILKNIQFGMRLTHWGEDVVVCAQYPDEKSKMTHPYLYVKSRFGLCPWKETRVEMFADNWEVVEMGRD